MGQNVDFERVCRQEWMGMEFEYVRKLTQENDDCVLESNWGETHYIGSFPYMTLNVITLSMFGLYWMFSLSTSLAADQFKI